jgi:hypothetical protein
MFDEAKEIKNENFQTEKILIDRIRGDHSTIFPLQGGNLHL